MTNTDKYALEHCDGDRRAAIKHLIAYGNHEDLEMCIPEWDLEERNYARRCIVEYHYKTMSPEEFYTFLEFFPNLKQEARDMIENSTSNEKLLSERKSYLIISVLTSVIGLGIVVAAFIMKAKGISPYLLIAAEIASLVYTFFNIKDYTHLKSITENEHKKI